MSPSPQMVRPTSSSAYASVTLRSNGTIVRFHQTAITKVLSLAHQAARSEHNQFSGCLLRSHRRRGFHHNIRPGACRIARLLPRVEGSFQGPPAQCIRAVAGRPRLADVGRRALLDRPADANTDASDVVHLARTFIGDAALALLVRQDVSGEYRATIHLASDRDGTDPSTEFVFANDPSHPSASPYPVPTEPSLPSRPPIPEATTREQTWNRKSTEPGIRIPLTWLIAAGVAVASAGGGVYLATHSQEFFRRSAPTEPETVMTSTITNSGLDLEVTRSGESMRVTWNRNSPAVQTGTGRLIIADGGAEKSFGLDGELLRYGHLLYIPQNAELRITLAIEAAGKTLTESVQVVSSASGLVKSRIPSPVTVGETQKSRSLGEYRNEQPEASNSAGSRDQAAAGTAPRRFEPPQSAASRGRDANITFPAAALPVETVTQSSVSTAQLPSGLQHIPNVQAPAAEVPRPAPPAENLAPANSATPIAVPPKPKWSPRPVVPQQSLATRSNPGGKVEIRVLIDAKGTVTKATIIQGYRNMPREIANAALQTARQWVFEPALLRGSPTPSETVLAFVYPPSR